MFNDLFGELVLFLKYACLIPICFHYLSLFFNFTKLPDIFFIVTKFGLLTIWGITKQDDGSNISWGNFIKELI